MHGTKKNVFILRIFKCFLIIFEVVFLILRRFLFTASAIEQTNQTVHHFRKAMNIPELLIYSN